MEHLYYVGADARQSGILQGELAVDLIKEDDRIDKNKDGKIQYVVLEGEWDTRMQLSAQKMQ